MDKLAMLEKSYQEVLDATKHQDDKVGRVLTAAAFLTTGAIALVTHTYAPSVRLVLPDGSIPIVTIGVAIFFSCTAYAVIALLLSLATPHVYLSDVDHGFESLLFFHEIGRLSRTDWERRWTGRDDATVDKLQKSYLRESLNLARRVKLKYRRTSHAVRVFEVGIFYLVVGVTAFLLGFLRSPSVNPDHPIPILPAYPVRVLFFIAITAYLVLQMGAIRDQARYDRHDMAQVLTADQRYTRQTTSRLSTAVLACLIAFEAATLFTTRGTTHLIVWIVVATCGFLLAAFIRPRVRATQIDASGATLPVDGGRVRYLWIGGCSRRTIYRIVALGCGLGLIALGATVSELGSAEWRLIAAGAMPLLVLFAGGLQGRLPMVNTP